MPVIPIAPPDHGAYGTPYQHTFAASASPAPNFSLSGMLPSGLSFDAVTATISGTPTQAGTFDPLTATASNGQSATQTCTIMIAKALLTIAADDKTMVAGEALPALRVRYSGFGNHDYADDLDTPVSLSTTAPRGSLPGSYPIVFGGAADANYTITFVNGTLTTLPVASVPQLTVYLPVVTR